MLETALTNQPTPSKKEADTFWETAVQAGGKNESAEEAAENSRRTQVANAAFEQYLGEDWMLTHSEHAAEMMNFAKKLAAVMDADQIVAHLKELAKTVKT